jgi:hypothetical protein
VIDYGAKYVNTPLGLMRPEDKSRDITNGKARGSPHLSGPLEQQAEGQPAAPDRSIQGCRSRSRANC